MKSIIATAVALAFSTSVLAQAPKAAPATPAAPAAEAKKEPMKKMGEGKAKAKAKAKGKAKAAEKKS